jgi:hypothetical protein
MAEWAAAAKDNPGYTLKPSPTRPLHPSFVTGPWAFLQSEKFEQSARRSDKWGEPGSQVVQEQSCMNKLDWPCFPPPSLHVYFAFCVSLALVDALGNYG